MLTAGSMPSALGEVCYQLAWLKKAIGQIQKQNTLGAGEMVKSTCCSCGGPWLIPSTDSSFRASSGTHMVHIYACKQTQKTQKASRLLCVSAHKLEQMCDPPSDDGGSGASLGGCVDVTNRLFKIRNTEPM